MSKMGEEDQFWAQKEHFELFPKSVYKIFFEVIPDDKH